MKPDQITAIRQACANIISAAEQIDGDAKDGASPYDSNGAPGLWLRDLETNLATLKSEASK